MSTYKLKFRMNLLVSPISYVSNKKINIYLEWICLSPLPSLHLSVLKILPVLWNIHG